MAESLEGGFGPPRAVTPMEEEEDFEYNFTKHDLPSFIFV
jgi:hypothetical protein